MLCDCCQEREATIHLTQVVDGNSREVHLCPDCAEEHGLDLQSAMSIPEALFGLVAGNQPGAPAAAPRPTEKTCAHCHLRVSDYKRNGRLGCPRCYETFAEEFQPVLAGMHQGLDHKGKTPQRHPPPPPAAPPRKAAPRRASRKTAPAAQGEGPEKKPDPSGRSDQSDPSDPPAPAAPHPPADADARRRDLERRLADAIRAENYEEAARLRDALRREDPAP